MGSTCPATPTSEKVDSNDAMSLKQHTTASGLPSAMGFTLLYVGDQPQVKTLRLFYYVAKGDVNRWTLGRSQICRQPFEGRQGWHDVGRALEGLEISHDTVFTPTYSMLVVAWCFGLQEFDVQNCSRCIQMLSCNDGEHRHQTHSLATVHKGKSSRAESPWRPRAATCTRQQK